MPYMRPVNAKDRHELLSTPQSARHLRRFSVQGTPTGTSNGVTLVGGRTNSFCAILARLRGRPKPSKNNGLKHQLTRSESQLGQSNSRSHPTSTERKVPEGRREGETSRSSVPCPPSSLSLTAPEPRSQLGQTTDGHTEHRRKERFQNREKASNTTSPCCCSLESVLRSTLPNPAPR
jgi:hypothetical protein